MLPKEYKDGVMVAFQGATPLAGAAYVLPEPAYFLYEVFAVRVQLTCSAAIAVRYLYWSIEQLGSVYVRQYAQLGVAGGSRQIYNFYNNWGSAPLVGLSGDAEYSGYLLNGYFIGINNTTFNIGVENMDAADEIQNIVLMVRVTLKD